MKNNKLESKFSIIVNSFDGYSDLLDDFLNLFYLNWKNCPYDIYIANGEKKIDDSRVIVVNSGKNAEWSNRTRNAIKKTNSKYVLLLLDDYFIGDKIDNKEIIDRINFIEKNNIKYYKFSCDSTNLKKETCYKGFKGIHTIPTDFRYGISLQPAIWERDYLNTLLGDGNYSSWKFEFDRINELDKNKKIYKNHVYDDTNIFNILHMVVGGKIILDSFLKLKKKNYTLMTNRQKMNIIEFLMYKTKLLASNLFNDEQKSKIKNFFKNNNLKK